MNNSKSRVGGIDPAALAAACVSVAVSVVMPAGAYGPLSIMFGGTVLVLVLAYDEDPHRDRWQSFGFSLVIGLIAQSALGFFLEAIFSNNFILRLSLIWTSVAQCNDAQLQSGGALNCIDDRQSSVPARAVLFLWLLCSGLTFFIDRWRSSKRNTAQKGLQAGEDDKSKASPNAVPIPAPVSSPIKPPDDAHSTDALDHQESHTDRPTSPDSAAATHPHSPA